MVTLGYVQNNKLILVPSPSTFPASTQIKVPKPKDNMPAPFDVHSENLYPQSSASTMRGDDASVAPSQAETLTPERDEMQRFTATGRR